MRWVSKRLHKWYSFSLSFTIHALRATMVPSGTVTLNSTYTVLREVAINQWSLSGNIYDVDVL